jgi:hypothetical protein
MAGYVHATSHVVALPVSTFIVHALLSLQLVGQLPGGSHVSLASTTPLPHIGIILPLDEDILPLEELPLDDDAPLPDDDELADDEALLPEDEESPAPPIPPSSPLTGSLITPVQPLDMTPTTPKMSVPVATQRL